MTAATTTANNNNTTIVPTTNNTKPPLSLKVSTYDVFAVEKFTGNQLAVFTGDDCSFLTSEQMQRLAFEMNYAESAFVIPRPSSTSTTKDDDDQRRTMTFRYRIFTPEFELPFAGHPTLGTAYHLFHDKEDNGGLPPPPHTSKISLECTGGIIPVRVTTTGDSGSGGENDLLYWMSQRPPKRETPVDGKIPFEKIAVALGLGDAENADENGVFDESYPPLVYSTGGTPFLVVAVRSVEILTNKIRHTGDREKGSIVEFCDELGCVGIYAVAKGGRQNDHQISARSMINETNGMPEDPATGSACGCFAGWSVNVGFLPDGLYDETKKSYGFVVGQGHEIGRPSLLHVEVRPPVAEGEETEVSVGGKVFPILSGGRIAL